MPSSHLILCHPLLLLPSILPSIRVLSSELALHISWQNYWSFSFSISPSNEYSGLISFRIDWLNLLAVQEALKSFLQQHSLKASVIWHSAFVVQLSHPYLTTGKTIALTIWTGEWNGKPLQHSCLENPMNSTACYFDTFVCCNMIANIVRFIRYDNSELWELLKNIYQSILGEILSIQGETSVIPANPDVKEIVTENK